MVVAIFQTVRDWDDHMDWDGGWEVAMMLGVLIFWVLVVALVVWVVRELVLHRGVTSSKDGSKAPLEILDERLADGTISPSDYQERRRILKGDQPSSS